MQTLLMSLCCCFLRLSVSEHPLIVAVATDTKDMLMVELHFQVTLCSKGVCERERLLGKFITTREKTLTIIYTPIYSLLVTVVL